MRRCQLSFATLLLALVVTPAPAATTYRVKLHTGYDVTQATPLQHAASFPIGASNGTATFTGQGFAYPGQVGLINHNDMTWNSGFSGGSSSEVICSIRAEDFVISGPAAPSVAGTLHFRMRASYGRLGGFAGNNAHGSGSFVRVSVNGIVATGNYYIGNANIATSEGVLSGLSGESIDKSFDVSGTFPVNSPFAVEMMIDATAYTYGNVGNTNPGFSEVSAGSSSAPGGGGGLSLQESGGAVMALPAGYTLNSATWAVTDNHYSPTVAVEPSTARDAFALAAEPNPSAAAVTLRFTQPRDGAVAIDVFDASGRRVRRILDAWMPAGQNTVAWDGRDASGARVAPGLWFVRFEGAGRAVTRRIVRVE